MPFPGMASCTHPENAMPWRDMEAIQRVAHRRNEVITFRSTGPWAKRWIERGYPTKGFHVKGKSSDWGPQAGLVPWEGRFSKVSPDQKGIDKGNAYNLEGVSHGYAKKIPLVLTWEQLIVQHTVPAGSVPRIAVAGMSKIDGTDDWMLHAVRPKDGMLIPFRAVTNGRGEFMIYCYSDFAPFDIKSLEGWDRLPLEVMASTEAGSDRPMTGDYDLFNICPTWESYGSAVSQTISFEGTAFGSHGAESVTFRPGTGMDRVMDTRLHTGTGGINGYTPGAMSDYSNRRKAYLARYATMMAGSHEHSVLKSQLQKLGILDAAGNELKEAKWGEHGDMGNLTPRILQCILDLNVEMGSGEMGLTRRVHHNAESHRNHQHGGIKGDELEAGEGLPITIFQPNRIRGRSAMDATGYDTIDTIVTWEEFLKYSARLKDNGFVVPQAWHWAVPPKKAS